MKGFARLTPVCEASNASLYSYHPGSKKGPDGRAPCPVCGKSVKLRKLGADRFPSTIPHHHDERASNDTGASND